MNSVEVISEPPNVSQAQQYSLLLIIVVLIMTFILLNNKLLRQESVKQKRSLFGI